MKQNKEPSVWIASQFKSEREKWIFLCVLVLALSSPLLLQPFYDLKATLTFPNNESGAFHYNREILFNEEGEVDILFLGCSYLKWQVDFLRFESLLSQKLQRPTVVRSLGFDMRANELLYLYLKEFLKHRQSQFVVISPNMKTRYPFPHKFLHQVANSPTLAVHGLGILESFKLYSASIYGFLFQVKSLILGNSSTLDLRMRARLGTKIVKPRTSIGERPQPEKIEGASMVYGVERKAELEIVPYPLENQERVFFHKILNLLRDKKIAFSFLIPPSAIQRENSHQMRSDRVVMQGDLFQEFGSDASVIGLSMDQIFYQQSEELISQHFTGIHLNFRGAQWFTERIFDGVYYAYKKSLDN